MLLTLTFLCAVLLSEGSSSQTQPNNSSGSLIQDDQCVTREEVQSEIQAQTNHLESHLQRVTREEVQAMTRRLQDEMQAQIQSTKTQLRNDIQSIANQLQGLFRIGSFQNPAQSCRDLQGSSSNYYWIQNTKTGTATRQYCHMTRRCCGSTSGWMQVANLDMTDSSQHCPSGFRQITSPRRTCGKHSSGCVSATFPVHGVEYSRVCGRVIGYQFGSPDGFNSYYKNRARTIDSNYVDGVSVTHGQSPREHIWTFAAAVDESTSDRYRCPCTNRYHTFTGRVPPFVGNDYFCDTGSRSGLIYRYVVEDPLWNGQGCGSVSSCCSFNNPPWICKRLPQSTADDIEVRLCTDEGKQNEDIPLEVIELYVQ